MTPARIAEIRALLSDATACEFADLTATCGELVDEVERLGAAGEGLRQWLDYMDDESDGLAFAQTEEKGRELGLWEEE